MKIGDQKVVTLTYELKKDNAQGQMIQKVDKDRPFVYLFGVGGLLPKFENSLKDLETGDTFSFGLTPEEGYGHPSEKGFHKLDKKMFEIDGKIEDGLLEPGNMITMQDTEGNPVDCVVAEVSEDSVIMDSNHPLAGMNLHFSGEILEVREATKEELDHGHAHGPHGTQH